MENIHLITIHEFKHFSKYGEILESRENIKNIIHLEGEEYILKALFNGGNNPNIFIPDRYYFGLDNRPTLNKQDIFTSIIGEPSTAGYTRQSIDSSSGFTVVEVESEVLRAQSIILNFSAAAASWGPVKNLFMTDQADNSGFLICSVNLGSEFTIDDGESVTMRMSFGLGCS